MRSNFMDTLGQYPIIGLIGRVVLTLMFWSSGLEKIEDFSGTVAQVQHYGLPAATLIAATTIVVQLGGSALVIWNGRFTWFGAGALAVFTLLTIPVAHAYWTLEGHARVGDLHLVLEHISVVGALLIVVANVPRRSTRAASGDAAASARA
jgi:transmembrane protein